MATKQLTRFEIKSPDEGTVRAVFASLGVKSELIDRDGDVTEHGAFTNGAPVVISAYGHKSWEGALPLGTGTIHEDGDEAIFEGKFLLDTQHGADAFRTVKAISAAGMQEWSYSLHDVVAERVKLGDRDVRVLKKISVHEVSPVLKGAGVGTRTIEAKGLKFSEHFESVVAGVEAFAARHAEVVALRAEKGKSVAEYEGCFARLEAAVAALKGAHAPVSPASHDELTDLWLQFVALSQGVTREHGIP